jgi:ligand-binding sensor domain-containing protein
MFIQNGNWKTQKEMKIDSDEDAIYWISAYNEDTLLMCYKFGSLVIYDGKNFKRFNKSNSSIPLEGYYSICSDKNKIIWAGSFVEGVVRFDGKQFVLLNKDNSGLKGNMIFSIFVDTKNNKWFSTFKNGICIFNEEGVRLN